MKPGVIYKIIHQAFGGNQAIQAGVGSVADIQVIVEISDNDNLIDDSADPAIHTLIAAGQPGFITSIDNSEDPFTPVRPQQYEMRFISDNGINMNTFASGSDQRWGVHSYIGTNTQTIFKGFLVLDDMSEAFMPEGNEVLLTANDGLGLLSEIPLTDFDEENPTNVNRIIDYIAWALSKTGLQLQINCAFNIKNSGLVTDISTPSTSNQHFFDYNYLDAKTFEDKIGTSINCLEMLRRILGEEADISQRQGMWWIKRIDEIEASRGLYISTFDYLGNFIENLGEKQFVKQIGKDSPYTMFFSEEGTEVIPSRPLKALKLIYPYETPLEVPCNIDYIRGELSTNGTLAGYTLYDIECWTTLRDWGSNITSPNTTAHIARAFNALGYETERFIAILQPASFGNPPTYIRSEKIPVSEKDRFTFSMDYSGTPDNNSAANFILGIGLIVLYGDDGSVWVMDCTIASGLDGKWYLSDPEISLFRREIEWDYSPDTEDLTDWKNFSITSQNVPTNGSIVIHLYAANRVSDAADDITMRYSNLSFEYHAYINGAYKLYTSQSQTVTQAGNFKAKREKEVYISNSPKKLFKGALQIPLLYVEIYNASAIFVAPNIFKVAGDKRHLFMRNQRINIELTASNNQQTIVRSTYYTIIGNETLVEISGTAVAETITTKISEMTYELAGNYYNAAAFPAGPPDSTYEHPYSEIQVFDVWNQFKDDKRIFQAIVQGMDLHTTDTDALQNNAHLIHKWYFQDTDYNTNNKLFLLMTFGHDLYTQEWRGTFWEVYNVVIAKSYTGRTFKYET